MAKINSLTEGPIFQKILSVAWPVLLTSISQMAYNLTDMFWLGKLSWIGRDSSEAIAAVGTAALIAWFSFGLILIAKIGTSVRVSHAAGRNDHHGISRYASNGMILQVVLAVFFTSVVLIWMKPIIGIFQIQSSSVISLLITYLSIISFGFVFQFLSNGFAAINEGLGLTSLNFRIMVVGLIINVVLDPLMIFVFPKGVGGAALATLLAQMATFGVYLIYYFKNNREVHALSFKAFDVHAMKDIVSIGIVAGIQSMFFTSISIVISRMIYAFGDDYMSAQRVGVQIEQFTWMISSGFQSALMVFVGQNYGAGNAVRIKKGVLALSAMLIPYALVVALSMYFFPSFFMELFVSGEPQVVAYGAEYLKIVSLSQVFMMMEAIGGGLFSGVGNTIVPSTSSIVNNFLRIPLAYWLIPTLSVSGIWWAINISAIAKGLIMFLGSILLFLVLERRIAKRKAKQLIKEAIHAS